MTKKLTALLLLWLLTFSFVHAETIVVTSNADSGPGTLREVIEKAAANGTAATDYIHFNISIADFKGRIINLLTELPALTSNLVIDGTTQPGEAYATTDAKICIKMDVYAPSFAGFTIENASNIQLYGFYIFYGYLAGISDGTFPRSQQLYGVSLSNAFNINIGAPGKGNVINGVVHGIYSNSDSCRNIVIQSNYLGLGSYFLNTDPSKEIAETVLIPLAGITLANVKDITIGGPAEEEGNVFGFSGPVSIDSKYKTGNGFIRIQHNLFNRWYDRKTTIRHHSSWEEGLSVGRNQHNPIYYHAEHQVDYQLFLFDNDVSVPARFSYLSRPFIIQRNQFYWELGGSNQVPKCVVEACTGGGLIGDEDEANQNIFRKKESKVAYYALTVFDCGPVTILKNIFECNSAYTSTTLVKNAFISVPFAQVDKTTTTSVQGRATPNCRIDLYYDDECTACEGKQYVTTIRSDASGNWTYTGTITGTILAVATSNNGYSSSFSTPTFNYDNEVVKSPTCGKANGSITGITAEGAEAYFWINEHTLDTVSRTIDLYNVGAGNYLLLARHGTNCFQPVLHDYFLTNSSPRIQRGGQQITQPACGGANGSIYGFTIYDNFNSIIAWKDAQGNVVGTEADISDLAPGTYTLSVTDTTGGCFDSETVVLTNQSGPSLERTNIKITNASCGASNGSIKNITVANATGEAFLQWLDESGKAVGNALDLTNVPGGRYRLQFKDEGACDTITTAYYTIGGASSSTIDESNVTITPSQCRYPSGTIQNIAVSGASNFEWINAAGTVVSRQQDPGLLLPGTYTLIVGKATGCPRSSGPLTVPVDSFMKFTPELQIDTRPDLCDKGNAYVHVPDFPDPQNYTFRWFEKKGDTHTLVGTSLNLDNVPHSYYYLLAKDRNGCEQHVTAALFEVNYPEITLDESYASAQDASCGRADGKIEGLQVTPGTGWAPYTYHWQNSQDRVVGTEPGLKAAGGQYRMVVQDKYGCADSSRWYTLNDKVQALPPPPYTNQTIPKNTAATLSVQNFQPGTYQLFQNPNSATPLQQNETGLFITGNLPADTMFYIKLKTGSCESGVTPVFIKVVDDTKVYVPTGFTPNKDGKNDDIKPLVLGLFTLEHFTIYDRWGTIVFKSSDLSKGWNGFIKGSEAPMGVYVWLLKGKDFRGNTIQQKGTFTLLR